MYNNPQKCNKVLYGILYSAAGIADMSTVTFVKKTSALVVQSNTSETL